MIAYLIAWCLFSCAAYSLAKGKGRNPRLWAAIGLVLGPLAVLIVALMPITTKSEAGYK